MRFVDEYRDGRIGRAVAAQIRRKTSKPWVIMEICGGQTHTLVKYGIEEILPPELELVHGPGCPVCVTPIETVDRAMAIASRPDSILVSYGDMLRVPGSSGDLFRVRASGGDVRIAYSPMEALKVARANPGKQVVFLAIGFETTAPANAMAAWQARREGLANFSLLVSQVLVPPAIRALLSSPSNRVQGFIAPGHVCTVMGYREYEEVAREFRVPMVVAGFEPVDLLQAISMLVAQLEEGRSEVENQYLRSVSREGNARARELIREVFEVADQKWRGIGVMAQSGLRLKPEFAPWDAVRVFGLEEADVPEPAGCIASQVLRGLKKPVDCPEFGLRCSPESPLGAPMVSSEGACAAYYMYKRERLGGVLPPASSKMAS